MKRALVLAVAVLLCAGCAFLNRENTPLANAVENHLIPSEDPGKVLSYPVMVPVGLVALAGDILAVHPVMSAEDALWDARRSVGLSASRTPALNWTARNLLPEQAAWRHVAALFVAPLGAMALTADAFRTFGDAGDKAADVTARECWTRQDWKRHYVTECGLLPLRVAVSTVMYPVLFAWHGTSPAFKTVAAPVAFGGTWALRCLFDTGNRSLALKIQEAEAPAQPAAAVTEQPAAAVPQPKPKPKPESCPEPSPEAPPGGSSGK